ncbi:class I SAM-dependent methyltransferase [Parerythrobacter aestuarii]|uniref:class I SAM-dependent methyltransferase n=1 Tax=Parerythrobacter aestuarii TaxID=3020909 RepID=UPI0024DE902A|nr:class I SAM-dependent methyltransferase [Parerythrobacter aestuarii]
MSNVGEDAWGDFWAQQDGQGQGGCLPDGWSGIEALQRAKWQDWCAALPQQARVLDLATGDGRVLGWLAAKRPDLSLVGIDLAPELPTPPQGCETIGGIGMEKLPFDAGSFDAVVSQFGFEYGNTAEVSQEVGRVLRPDGTVALMTHRMDGPILAHNRDRRMQIGWIFDRKDLFTVAHAALAHRVEGQAYVPPLVMQAVQEGAQRFGANSAAWEISEAIRRTLLLGAGVTGQQVASTLETLAGRARNEIGRINSLEQACRTTADGEGFRSAIQSGGLVETRSTPLSESGAADPFADFRELTLQS